MNFYIGQVFKGEYPPEAAIWCNENNAVIEELERTVENGRRFQIVEVKQEPLTADDYDQAMEDHIRTARVERGYTLREPSDYKDSSVPRWRSDAVDFIAFRDEVMLYGLEIQNRYREGLSVPTLEEFKEGLPECVWSFEG